MASGLPLSKTSPAFLHANSTSHTWIFSAIAEIVDNAYDPDVSARQLLIEKQTIQNEICLTFTDNGNGLNAEKLLKMLSFGYCEKDKIVGAHTPVGHYGNGFKSGSMRLGKDAMVFTRQKDTMSIGFLSQTFLKNINAETVVVPIISYDTKTKAQIALDGELPGPESGGLSQKGEESRISNSQSAKSLKAITSHSLFKSEQALLRELEDMQEGLQGSASGTKIIIYNLKRTSNGRLELDFESDPIDMINPESQEFDVTNIRTISERVPEYRRSLREYLSILFLKPRMRIILRGKKVKTKLVSKSLSRTERDVYKPHWLSQNVNLKQNVNNRPVTIVFGFSPNKEDYGLMIYNKNRLIKAYEHVGCQKSSSSMEKKGVGVVGVVELDFLTPIHNKQDFNKTDRYNATLNAIGNKLTEYWTTKTNQVVTMGGVTIIEPTSMGLPDWTWVQCDNCLKWRRLIDGSNESTLPEKWYCYMNRDPTHNRCEHEIEPEDEDELLLRATYEKTGPKIIKQEKRQRGKNLDKREEELRRQEEELRRKEQHLNTPLPPAAMGGSNQRPTMRDLEIMKRELEKAKQREQEQQQLIAKLRAHAPPVIPSKQLGYGRGGKPMGRNNPVVQQKGPNGQKRARPPLNEKSGPQGRKKSKPTPVLEKEDFVVTRNDPSESGSDSDDSVVMIEDDDVDDWRKKKKGKLPVLGRRAATEDIKPDVTALNAAMETATSNPSSASSSSVEDEKPNSAQLNKALNKDKATPSTSGTTSKPNTPNKQSKPPPKLNNSKSQTSVSNTTKSVTSSKNADTSKTNSLNTSKESIDAGNSARDKGGSSDYALPRLPDPVSFDDPSPSPMDTPDTTQVEDVPQQETSLTPRASSASPKNQQKTGPTTTQNQSVTPKTSLESSENKTTRNAASGTVPSNNQTVSTSSANPSNAELVTIATQTDSPEEKASESGGNNVELVASLKKEAEKARQKLHSLRTNVCELLKVIVPDVKVEKLAFVDSIVLKMIQVNSADAESSEENDKTKSPATTDSEMKEVKDEEDADIVLVNGEKSEKAVEAGTEIKYEEDNDVMLVNGQTDASKEAKSSETGTTSNTNNSNAKEANSETKAPSPSCSKTIPKTMSENGNSSGKEKINVNEKETSLPTQCDSEKKSSSPLVNSTFIDVFSGETGAEIKIEDDV